MRLSVGVTIVVPDHARRRGLSSWISDPDMSGWRSSVGTRHGRVEIGLQPARRAREQGIRPVPGIDCSQVFGRVDGVPEPGQYILRGGFICDQFRKQLRFEPLTGAQIDNIESTGMQHADAGINKPRIQMLSSFDPIPGNAGLSLEADDPVSINDDKPVFRYRLHGRKGDRGVSLGMMGG